MVLDYVSAEFDRVIEFLMQLTEEVPVHPCFDPYAKRRPEQRDNRTGYDRLSH